MDVKVITEELNAAQLQLRWRKPRLRGWSRTVRAARRAWSRSR
jgi:hypothetical protein